MVRSGYSPVFVATFVYSVTFVVENRWSSQWQMIDGVSIRWRGCSQWLSSAASVGTWVGLPRLLMSSFTSLEIKGTAFFFTSD